METNNRLDNFDDACFLDSLRLIHDLTGITIAHSRKSMVQGRLRKRMMELQIENYEFYLDLVKRDLNEKAEFINLVTTNETYFFRTPRIWNYIEGVFLPVWFSENPNKVFSAWSVAASTGDEAYSLGILLQAFKSRNPKFNFQILGTDISREMIARCRKGVYHGRAIELLRTTRPDFFSKFMQPVGDKGFEVLPEIKSRIRFQEHNLFKPLQTKDSFDLVLVRNVLIYFTGVDQEKVLGLIEPRLADSGNLIIGESESLSYIKTNYSNLQPLVYKKASTASPSKAS